MGADLLVKQMTSKDPSYNEKAVVVALSVAVKILLL